MTTHDFTLKSGAQLHISLAPFEVAIALVEAVKRVAVGYTTGTPEGIVDQAIFASAEVRKALYPVFDTVTYDHVRVTPALFDDPKLGEKARGDYYEICSRVIEVTSKPFFLRTSSAFTTSPANGSKSPESA